ncbi:hypothetical protein APS56_12400 [Pseudalgibacter alginicilyticus]|uniref:Secretion system C-terminal sorting domain-containing protein n=1 Tax=Pseudalgibacter alginicilyticus TaxID=1736674 RepID=A0A0P0CI78_9FLAO|nr:T9SS type A sorting domain-containing protein [Pseudalgibacter alginicilyticus]ALJ05881.1 hypothetical protein APS56_12400 [Pseudalgibacter alginicilyticus]
MQKKYFLAILFSLTFIIPQLGYTQSDVNTSSNDHKIEGLSIYPNPVQSGKQYIYITSKSNLTKKVEIYNVLGKQVYNAELINKELNISKLNSGVYILKVTENGISESRKLIIM